MTCRQIVAMIEDCDNELEECRIELQRVGNYRRQLVRGLVADVGAREAARLLGISRQAVYRAMRRP